MGVLFVARFCLRELQSCQRGSEGLGECVGEREILVVSSFDKDFGKESQALL